MRLPDRWKGPYWEPRDVWVGVYWTRDAGMFYCWLYVYVCLIPCFPIRLTWTTDTDTTRAAAATGGDDGE